MGGYGSGRNGGRPTVESTLRLDIARMMRLGAIQAGAHLRGRIQFDFYGDELEIQFESRLGHPESSWLRLTYAMTDYWTREELEICDRILLMRTPQRLGGWRWWFMCPRTRRRVRVLHLPLGGRHFWSRRAYRLGYQSQRETVYDRALRRARSLCHRLGGDYEYPDKPPRMRWTTYSRLMDKLVGAKQVVDERLTLLAARWASRGRTGRRARN